MTLWVFSGLSLGLPVLIENLRISEAAMRAPNIFSVPGTFSQELSAQVTDATVTTEAPMQCTHAKQQPK